jgi:Asp/Glu/hydantoin racemase
MQRVAILHTSLVFVNVEPVITDLIAELLPGVKVIHFIDSDVLAQVGRDTYVTDSSALRMMHLAQAAEAAGVDAIFSACSSLGPAIDRARELVKPQIIKIDDAMAAKAVSLGTRIGVLATVPTTLGPSSDLVSFHAREAGKTVTVVPKLAVGAFDKLMSNDREGHNQAVSTAAAELALEVDVIVCAQASMWRLADRLAQETGKPVLSSPRLGVEMLAEHMKQFVG